MKRSRVGRIIQILTALQAGKNYAVNDLSKIFRTSRRTVFRDLKELRSIGVPYHYDARTDGYTIEPEFFLPPIDLTLQEALSLLLLLHTARNNVGLGFRSVISRAAMKLQSNLPFEVKRYCNTAFRNIHVKAEPQARMDSLKKIFWQLLVAILRKRVIKIRYKLPLEEKSTVIDLCPYHLRYSDHTWYVLGKSSLYKSIHAFKLNRIRELTTLDKCFVEDEKFDIHEHLGKAWSMLPEGRLYNVKLRFLPEVAKGVAEVQWHSTQKVTFEDDGSAIVKFRVDGLSEITWWILGYGDKVQVLAPRILREKIIKIAQKMVKTNQQEPPVI